MSTESGFYDKLTKLLGKPSSSVLRRASQGSVGHVVYCVADVHVHQSQQA